MWFLSGFGFWFERDGGYKALAALAPERFARQSGAASHLLSSFLLLLWRISRCARLCGLSLTPNSRPSARGWNLGRAAVRTVKGKPFAYFANPPALEREPVTAWPRARARNRRQWSEARPCATGDLTRINY
jgi:hypothetical protein